MNISSTRRGYGRSCDPRLKALQAGVLLLCKVKSRRPGALVAILDGGPGLHGSAICDARCLWSFVNLLVAEHH